MLNNLCYYPVVGNSLNLQVVDLAQGHVKALAQLESQCGLKIYNLGTGIGYSVLEIAAAFSKASGKEVPL